MGILVTVGALIVEGIAGAVAAVSSVIGTITTAVDLAITEAGIAITGDVAGVSGTTLEALGIVGEETFALTTDITAFTVEASAQVSLETSTYIESVENSFSWFLETIHYDTLLKVHEIAYLVSGDYRMQVNKIYSRISEVSEALGLGAQFINLALRNARTISLGVDATLGRYYDVSEIKWMNSLSTYLGTWNNSVDTYLMFETGRYETETYSSSSTAQARVKQLNSAHVFHKATLEEKDGSYVVKYQVLEQSTLQSTFSYVQTYKDNPGQVFHDIDNHFIKPNIDEGAKGTQVMLGTVDSLIKGVGLTVEDIAKLSSDLQRFTTDLPESVRKHIEPYVLKVTEKVDGWIDNSYRPKMATIDDVLNVLSEARNKQTQRMDGLFERLRKPGRYLQEIDGFETEDRHEQEAIIGEISNRQAGRDVQGVLPKDATQDAKLDSVVEALDYKLEPLPILELEEPQVKKIDLEKAPPKSTWHVGDY